MKICLFSTTYFPKTGGAERFIHGLSKNLADRGHKVFVVVPYDPSLNLKEYVNYRILKIRFVRPFRNNARLYEAVLFLNLLFYFILYRFSLIQAVILYPSGFIASLFTKLFNIPSVLRPTGEDIQIHRKLNYGLRLNPFIDKRVKKALKWCSAIIAISPSVERDILSAVGYSRKGKIRPISNGINLERFGGGPKFDIKKDLSLGKSVKVIISIGRNHPKKDYKNLIKAVSLCPSNYHLVIIGGGEKPLEKFISEKDASRIHLLGQLPKSYSGVSRRFSFPPDIVVGYLKTSDVYASCSLIEGSPNVILEAMAAGLPVIAVDSPGTRDYVKNRENGVLVSAENPEAMAKALIDTFSDDKVLLKYSNMSKKLSLLYSFDSVANDYIKVYNSLVKCD